MSNISIQEPGRWFGCVYLALWYGEMPGYRRCISKTNSRNNKSEVNNNFLAGLVKHIIHVFTSIHFIVNT